MPSAMVLAGGDDDALTGGQGGLHGGHLLGLDADDPRARDDRLQREPDAADQPAAAHRHQHGVEVGHLLGQLEADRALAGDDTRVVEGMDEDQPALGLDLHGAGIGLVVVLSVQDDLGAVPPRPRDLAQRCPGRHGDDRGDAEAGRVKGHGEAMVARARRHDAAASLVGTELEQGIRGAALLERARYLEVLELEEDTRAGHRRQRLRERAGRDVDDAVEPGARRPDVVEGHGRAPLRRGGRPDRGRRSGGQRA